MASWSKHFGDLFSRVRFHSFEVLLLLLLFLPFSLSVCLSLCLSLSLLWRALSLFFALSPFPYFLFPLLLSL